MDNKIILLADDDIDDREMFCEALAKTDDSITCSCVVNGSELLSRLNEMDNKPELIFLDVNMPIMNGWQCLQLLKENDAYKQIPVVMISTSSHQKEMNTAVNLGALCYFVKPNNFNELTKVLHEIVTHLGDGLKAALQHLQLKSSGYIYTG